jgi:hypothetical protein
MWVAHFAPGLVAKIFAPYVPLSLLCLAGAAPDALFLILNFLGVESFRLDKSIVGKGGCFPYANDYPYSHSLVGIAVLGKLTLLGIATPFLNSVIMNLGVALDLVSCVGALLQSKMIRSHKTTIGKAIAYEPKQKCACWTVKKTAIQMRRFGFPARPLLQAGGAYLLYAKRPP